MTPAIARRSPDRRDGPSVWPMSRVAACALIIICFAALSCGPSFRQVPDLEFRPKVAKPSFPTGQGPLVRIDEAHFNFHTADGRYRTFAELLRRDGYRVEASTGRLDVDAATDTAGLSGDVLVIANPLARVNAENWELPNPSAFTESEIDALGAWIRNGGSLLLIADHMPFPGATSDLAESLGLLFVNGYAIHDSARGPVLSFERSEGSLLDHVITRGRNWRERVDHVVSFTGQVFRPKPGVSWTPLMTVPRGTRVLMPWKASRFDEKTPRFSAEGLWQGAVRRHGAGRIAVFGEAAMFSAQRIVSTSGEESPRAMGMNHDDADENPQFILNVMHWLTGLI